jgi:hypothetical protein
MHDHAGTRTAHSLSYRRVSFPHQAAQEETHRDGPDEPLSSSQNRPIANTNTNNGGRCKRSDEPIRHTSYTSVLTVGIVALLVAPAATVCAVRSSIMFKRDVTLPHTHWNVICALKVCFPRQHIASSAPIDSAIER